MLRRVLGSPALFALVWTPVAGAIYFALGVIAGRGLGLTPLVLLAAAGFFLLTAMTYVEGASLHQDRAGATVFARYAFNELWSFVAGWAILLDFLILIAVTAFVAASYLATIWSPTEGGGFELVLAVGIVGYVAARNALGFSRRRVPRLVALVIVDIALSLLVIVIGFVVAFDADALLDPIELGVAPRWEDVIFALTVATVAFVGLEAASGLAGEVRVGRAGLRRLVGSAALAVLVIYTGIALVGLTALPVSGGATALSSTYLEAPLVGVVSTFEPAWLADVLMVVVALAAFATLVAAANSAMMGLSRLAYALATNRQIPSAVGRLHPTRSTPVVVIALAAILAVGLIVPEDLEMLVGIYAFGALLAFLLAHLAIVTLRFREPQRRRPYRVPFAVRAGAGEIPLPAVAGAALSALALGSLIVLHEPARYVGTGWLLFGLALYVLYRRGGGKSLTQRVTIAEQALARTEAPGARFGSILVPILGTPLDDDLVQTAGRLAAEEAADAAESDVATIEAIWVFEVPMALALDARMPEDQLKRARRALARAKAVGEEYEGVEVATATVRGRKAGRCIVEEARRRGVQVIVLGAEEPSRIRRGALLGGRGSLDDFVGEATKYVVANAPCRVILTAPPAGEGRAGHADGAARGRDGDAAPASPASARR